MKKIYLVGPESKWDDCIYAFSSPEKAVDHFNEEARKYKDDVSFSLSRSKTEITSSNPEEREGYYIRISGVDTGEPI